MTHRQAAKRSGGAADQLREISARLFGNEWQTPLAAALGVSDRTVRRWASGEHAVPDNVAAALAVAEKAWDVIEPALTVEISLTTGRDAVGVDATAIVSHAVRRRGHRVQVVDVEGDDPAQRALAAAMRL